MNDTPTATRDVRIYDLTFSFQAPYAAGHTINETEARVLNQTRAENIANNIRADVKEVLASLEGKSEEERMEAISRLMAEVAEYDEQYSFSESAGGGVGRSVLDPVEREARRIAKNEIGKALKQNGKKVKDIAEDKYEAAVAAYAARPEVIVRAQKAVEDMQKRAVASLADLGLAA